MPESREQQLQRIKARAAASREWAETVHDPVYRMDAIADADAYAAGATALERCAKIDAAIANQSGAMYEELMGDQAFAMSLVDEINRQHAEEIAALEAELAEARKDSARLDWLEAQCKHQATVPQFWRNRNRKISFAPYDEARCWEGDDIRAAIDAAREVSNG